MPELNEIVQAARRGDPAALERLIAASYRDVWRLCAALVDERSAEDLTQETFARMLRALRGYRGEASVRTWILSIARRTCADELRARTRTRRRDSRLARVTTEDAAPAPEVMSTVGAAALLSQLEPDRRAAFALTQLFRLSYEDAAIACECQPGTIRSRVARARAELIELLGEQDAPAAARSS